MLSKKGSKKAAIPAKVDAALVPRLINLINDVGSGRLYSFANYISAIRKTATP